MKKLLVVLVVLCFAAPAAAVDWNFYGSARVETWYDSRDYGDGTNTAGTDDQDAELIWDLQGNSRIGAKVKHEAVSGQVELALKGDGGGDLDVGTRRIHATWNFGPASLTVGKDYTPVSQFISGQAFDVDLGLLGIGTQYGNRVGQLKLDWGGFQIALIDPDTSRLPVGLSEGNGIGQGDVDTVVPKIEAQWGMSFDTWNFAIQGGYQYYTIEDVTNLAGTSTNDVDVDTYTIGAMAGVNFGPAYVKGSISYGANWYQAKWGAAAGRTDTSGARWDGDDGIDDVKSLQWALVAGFKVSDMLSLEAGFGWRQDDPDNFNPAVDASGDNEWQAYEVYGQAVIALAPGVWLIPEIGYTDYGDNFDNDDEGDRWYAGGKWQIDF